jgi:hypothetical protein
MYFDVILKTRITLYYSIFIPHYVMPYERDI